ncbi:MAG: SH3 domain-containing protein [Clostridiales bacterium]|nr:SH3 domain-containing protein [Clostridiales bacterium]
MKRHGALKTAVFAVSALAIFSITKDKVYASQSEKPLSVEYGVAGISKTLDEVFSCGDDAVNDKITELYDAEIYSPLWNLGVSIATNYVNVRSKPSTDGEIVGKLYHGCAAEILEWKEDGWVKIVSGDVEGYILSDYLAIGKEAEREADEHADKFATVVGTQTLRVREQQSTESRTLELIPLGERYPVIKEYDQWAEILISTDDNGNDFTGFVHKDYVDIEIIFKKAISIEEEQRIIREQQEAERAEAERLQRLAEENERKRLEAERKAAEEKKKSEEAKKAEQEKKESNKSSSNSSGSALGREIANYAQKFVGNPYVWGGESLTRGADCSGFVYTIYKQYGYSLDRVSKDQAKTAGRKVDINDRQPGDLIFYTNSRGVVNHVAMYIGNDKIVHAANSRQGIIISKFNYRKVYCIRRVV